MPVAVIDTDATSGAEPLTVEFSAERSTDADGIIFRYEWLFGDGATSHDRDEDHTYTAPGTYTATLVVRDNDGGVGMATRTIVVASGTPPVVNAGPDQSLTLPASANLDGTVTDDGLPNPPAAVTTLWSKVSGFGTVTFGNAAAVDTSASFSVAGTYVLRLTASDSAFSASDDVTLVVNFESSAGFSDAFDRSDSTALGNGWSEVSGDFTISAQQLRNSAVNATHVAVLPSLTGSKQAVAADFASTDNNGSPRFGVVLRYQGPGNYYLISRATGGASQLRVSRFAGGVETVLGTASISNPVKNVFFRLEGTADESTIRLKLDGVQKISIQDSTYTSGSLGVRVATPSLAVSHRIDNVSATVQ
jgi:PKD repeat protein